MISLTVKATFNQSTRSLHSRRRSCCTGTGTISYSMGFGYLCSARKRGARKCNTKMHSLTESVSALEVACTAGSTGIESAFWLLTKYWSTYSTKAGTRVGVALLNRPILCRRGMTCPRGTLLPLKLMDSSLHLTWPPLSRRPATIGSLLSISLKGQAGKIKQYIIQLTGWHLPGQENNCHRANA